MEVMEKQLAQQISILRHCEDMLNNSYSDYYITMKVRTMKKINELNVAILKMGMSK